MAAPEVSAEPAAALDREARLLRDAARIAGIGAWEFDVEQQRLHWSDAVCAMHGVAPGDEPALDAAIDFYDEASRPAVRAALNAALNEGKPYDVELGFVTGAGELRRVRTLGSAEWRDGRVVRLAGLFHDVTAQHQARTAIVDLSERLHLATEAAGVGIWDWSLEPKQVNWNAQMFRLHGMEPTADGRMTPRRWAELLHPDDRARVAHDVDEALAGRVPMIDHRYRIVRPDGEVRHVHSVGRESRHRRTRCMVGINIDISDSERAAEAQRARERAESARRAQNDLFSRVSHELRTPLNGVLGFTQLLQQRGAELPDWAAMPLARIRASGEQLLVLVDELLQLGDTVPPHVAAAAPRAAPPPTATPAPAPARVRLLYIEDNPVNVLLLREALALHGDRFELRSAPDGERGLQALREQRPDLLLLDLNLPDMGGHEVLALLRADPALADLPCIAVSADAMPQEIRRALDAGFDGYWTKPLDIARLPGRIAEAVRAGRTAPPGRAA